MIVGVRDDRIAWARLYMEPVERGGAGIEAAVQRMRGDLVPLRRGLRI